MSTEYFVHKNSIVRKIWGKSDTIIFIFAGASAEFALNKAVDWLYFTGKLPKDPLGRLFSTVAYARLIVFAEKESAIKAISSMAAIHSQVETNRQAKIPDWAYRDVLFMLIVYSIKSFEVLERKLTIEEKKEVFDVFNRVGLLMGLKGLPSNYEEWQSMRQEHLSQNMKYSYYTDDLFRQYRKHLGLVRYRILLEVQRNVIPVEVKEMLRIKNTMFISNMGLSLYKLAKALNIDSILKAMVLPANYKEKVKALDNPPE
ncbi:oxygenase MpaB family protein [Flavobacterium alkalisoli]|uniref:oxygenase MpaB family protein n=1 Tax=Flavobacterium alkalisoli TaxID=2602769 RepID=UPI003A93373D